MPTHLLRVNRLSETLIDRIIEYFQKYEMKVFGVYEYHNDNHHYHFWIETELVEKTVREHLQKYMPELKGKGKKMSFSRKHTPNLRYLCKGPLATLSGDDAPGERSNPIVVVNTMQFTQVHIDEAHEAFWAQFEQDIKTNKLVKKEKKEKKPTFLEVVREKWDKSDIKYKLMEQYRLEKFHDRWFVDRMCEDIAIWLMDEFECLGKLDDLPIQTKYASLLFKSIGTSRELMNAWKGGRDSFFR